MRCIGSQEAQKGNPAKLVGRAIGKLGKIGIFTRQLAQAQECNPVEEGWVVTFIGLKHGKIMHGTVYRV